MNLSHIKTPPVSNNKFLSSEKDIYYASYSNNINDITGGKFSIPEIITINTNLDGNKTYGAESLITTDGNVIVSDPSYIRLVSRGNILLNNGFHVTGSETCKFKARVVEP